MIAGLIISRFLSSETELLPIKDEAGAIAYAKTDTAVKEFIARWTNKGFEIKSWAKFENTVWTVVFYPDKVMDVAFDIEFDSNGRILKKGEMEGG
ncbi:MAG: hypothetical protein FJZ11_02135 [Candidatus Omnitrophica bacterium]|nr:hypothetical protein [Candidatus Omnitrophota bacterium]